MKLVIGRSVRNTSTSSRSPHHQQQHYYHKSSPIGSNIHTDIWLRGTLNTYFKTQREYSLRGEATADVVVDAVRIAARQCGQVV